MKLLIIKKNKLTNSETFIIDHAKGVSFDTVIVHGMPPVIYNHKEGSLSTNLYFISSSLESYYANSKKNTYKLFFSNILRKINPDVVLAEYGVTASRIYDVCEKNKIPLVIHFHGYDAHKKSVVEKNAEDYKKMFKSCRSVIVVSKRMRNAVIELGANPDTTFINPCGVDTTMFSKRKNIQKYFLSVGRFVEKKAPQITLLAFSKILNEFPDFKLIMIGDGPLLNTCKDLSEALGIKPNVDFLGSKPHDIVKRYMQEAYAFLQHSIVAFNGDSEGSPVSVAEASACGLPVISTDHAGIPDIIIDGKTGFIVPEKDAGAMADAMRKLVLNEKIVCEMSKEAIKQIKEFYSQNVIMKRLDRIIEWSIGRHGKMPPLFPSHIKG